MERRQGRKRGKKSERKRVREQRGYKKRSR